MEQRKRNVYKMKCANEREYNIIRLLQEDVLKNKNNWKKKLSTSILNIINNTIMNQYISKTNIYSEHIDDMKNINNKIKNLIVK